MRESERERQGGDKEVHLQRGWGYIASQHFGLCWMIVKNQSGTINITTPLDGNGSAPNRAVIEINKQHHMERSLPVCTVKPAHLISHCPSVCFSFIPICLVLGSQHCYYRESYIHKLVGHLGVKRNQRQRLPFSGHFWVNLNTIDCFLILIEILLYHCLTVMIGLHWKRLWALFNELVAGDLVVYSLWRL